jgi:hypothetical protein
MIELANTLPDVNVQPAEYARLLGYPRDWVLEGRAQELADWARSWYAKNGRPWTYARQAEAVEISDNVVSIEGVSFTSKGLREILRNAEAHSVVLVAVGAGSEAEEEAHRRWEEGKPDEYFFLEMYASAVVEHLTTMTGANLCDWAERHQMAVLPHYSPGYPEWDVSEQARLLALIKRHQPLPSCVEVLDSGMLRPKKALLAVFGLTRHAEHLRRLTDLIPCENCSFGPCKYRRAPYRRAPRSNSEQVAQPAVAALDLHAAYSVNPKALKRWAQERLSLKTLKDGTIAAQFRYEGTTCSNMGRPLTFLYSVKLGPRHEGYPIREQSCAPAAGDTGHTQMCQYIEDAQRLMAAVEREKPLNGDRLDSVLTWTRTQGAAGCYCEASSRDHKWGLVLETIHYALAQQEMAHKSN